LSRAGINGDYLHSKVTHDEVDAITSALVGLFYMADEYIGLSKSNFARHNSCGFSERGWAQSASSY